MSNRVTLQAVTFNYLNGSVSYGYILSDNYVTSIDSNAESLIKDDLDLLRYVFKTADTPAEELLYFIKETETGLCINDSWYDWENIKKLWYNDLPDYPKEDEPDQES